MIQAILVAAGVSLVVGFSTGYYVKAKFTEAEIVERIVEVRKEDARAVADMAAKEGAIQDRVEKTRERIKTVTKEVIKYVHVPTPVPSGESEVDCGDAFLSVGVTSLLNSARSGIDLDPATLGDEKGKAPSTSTFEDLVTGDLEVVQMYHELAENHNALVDYVQGLIDKQQERLKSGAN